MTKRILEIVLSVVLGCGVLSFGQTPQNRAPQNLSLKEAEAIALKTHPQVQAAEFTAMSSSEIVREVRSAYLPTLAGDVTGAGAERGIRVGAGFFSNPRILSRFSQGLTISQLITDSGRTPNLVQSSKLQAQADQENVQSTRYQVLLNVNQAYYNVLRAQTVVKVAEETVAARQLVVDQVTALAKSKLKSELDVSFASVNLAEAKLLLIGAQNDVEKAFAELSRALGNRTQQQFKLVDEPLPPSPAQNPDELVAQALAQRPELLALRLRRDADFKYERAERDLAFPTVSLFAAAGFLPEVANPGGAIPLPNHYDAAVVNVQIPVFNGHLFAARRAAASFRAQASDQQLRDAEDRIARDVRSAWADAMTSYQRLDVTAQLLQQATLALELAQGRYNLGLSSIVELSQGQLNLTQAQITNASAKYDYQIQHAVLAYEIGQLR
ncbi:MAG: TolC family protein [Terriglobia bacterium]|jgi:outer membrane protein